MPAGPWRSSSWQQTRRKRKGKKKTRRTNRRAKIYIYTYITFPNLVWEVARQTSLQSVQVETVSSVKTREPAEGRWAVNSFTSSPPRLQTASLPPQDEPGGAAVVPPSVCLQWWVTVVSCSYEVVGLIPWPEAVSLSPPLYVLWHGRDQDVRKTAAVEMKVERVFTFLKSPSMWGNSAEVNVDDKWHCNCHVWDDTHCDTHCA